MNDETTGSPYEELKVIDWTKPVRTVEVPHVVPKLVEHTNTIYTIRTIKGDSPGCRIGWVGYVDQHGRAVNLSFGPQVIENVPEEPEYIPLEIGDRLTIDNQEYMVVTPGGYCSLINLSTGRARAPHIKTVDGGNITLLTFKAALGSRADQWQEIYKTVRRRRG